MWDHDLNQAVGEQGWLDLDDPSTLLSCFLEGSPKESHNAVHCRMTLPNPPAPAQSDQSNTPISQWGGERLPIRNITEMAGEKPGNPCLARIYYCLRSAGDKAIESTLSYKP